MSTEPSSTANRERMYAAPASIKPAPPPAPPPPPTPKKRPIPRIRVEGARAKPPPRPLALTEEEKRLVLGYRAPRRWKNLSTDELNSYQIHPGEQR